MFDFNGFGLRTLFSVYGSKMSTNHAHFISISVFNVCELCSFIGPSFCLTDSKVLIVLFFFSNSILQWIVNAIYRYANSNSNVAPPCRMKNIGL